MATGELEPEKVRLGSVDVDSFPSDVERDAEHENGQQRNHRGRLVDEDREHEGRAHWTLPEQTGAAD